MDIGRIWRWGHGSTLGVVALATVFGSLAAARSAAASSFAIETGNTLGDVALGMPRSVVHARLHPPNRTAKLPGGVIEETWLSRPLTPAGSSVLQRNYLAVFYRRARVIQVEVSSPDFKTPSGLDTHHTAAEVDRQYPNHVSFTHVFLLRGDPTYSSPAPKHYITYGDDVKDGIAWKFGAWAGLAPTPDPDGPLEAIIVHQPGRRLMLNPNDGLPFAGTAPARKGVR